LKSFGQKMCTSDSLSSSSSWNNWQRFVSIALMGCVALVAWDSFTENGTNIGRMTGSPVAGSSATRRHLASKSDGGDCEKQCKDSAFFDLTYFEGEDLTKAKNMLARLNKRREQWVEKRLKKDYGAKYYPDIFEPVREVYDPETNSTSEQRVSAGRKGFLTDPDMLPLSKQPENEELAKDGPGWGRMVRKYQMKMIQIQLGIIEERLNVKEICLEECSAEDEANERFLRELGGGAAKKKRASHGLYTTFKHVNGGHSASAGHGNLYRESYTAQLDRALTPILASIGLDMVIRNYAMGGTESAEEVALCMNSIFGRDIDSVSW
jgi:hypothetical protein